VKLISALLRHLPDSYRYKIIFMRRNMQEILDSQRQMMIRRGEATDKVSDQQMSAMFEKHLVQVQSWLSSQPNIETIYVNYNNVLSEPRTEIEEINSFFAGTLDVERMVDVVDRALYRQKR